MNTEQHPAISAVGRHFDEEVDIAALARQYYGKEGCPEGHSLEHWLRAEREYHKHNASPSPEMHEAPPTEAELRTEELMHLDM